MSSSEEDDYSDSGDNRQNEEQQRPKKRSKKDNDDDAGDDQHLSTTPLETTSFTSSKSVLTNQVTSIKKQAPVIVLLDQATLETIKNRRGIYELLNCDDHREICKKKLHKDPNIYRPDILHQELLALLDSPLNKAGYLKVYISTTKKVLIDVHPSIRIPRTYKRFAGLMVQLLHKMKIKANNDSTTLLKVIKNPFSQHLPPGTRCYGFSCQGTLYSPVALAKTIVPMELPSAGGNGGGAAATGGTSTSTDAASTTPPTCLVIGAMSTGHVTIEDHPYIEKMLSISSYPLSGAAALSRVLGGIEHHWGIV